MNLIRPNIVASQGYLLGKQPIKLNNEDDRQLLK